MVTQINQKAILLIIALSIGMSLRNNAEAFYLIGGILLCWTLFQQSAITAILKRVCSPAPRNVVKPRPIPLCYVFDPESKSMTAVPRAAMMLVLEGKEEFPTDPSR